MKIRNTKLLVQRAESHAKHDRIAQGTYGATKTNGKTPHFKGCVIGCLATPHGEKGLRAFLQHTDRSYAASGERTPGKLPDGSGWGWLDVDSSQQLDHIEQVFGIPTELMRWAEDVFECFSHHGEAIEFVPEFCKRIALLEGIELTSDDLPDFQERALDAESLFEWIEERRTAVAA